MRVLVTGGSGLIGSHVIARLIERGVEVLALVRSAGAIRAVEALGAKPIEGDVRDRDAFCAAARGIDGLVHAAALVAARRAYDEFEDVNLGGTIHAVDAAARAGARLVHISSTSVYGRGLHAGPVDETFPFARIARRDFYARTKRAAEDVLRRQARAQRVHVTVLRPCVVYGERDRLFAASVARVLRSGIAPLVGAGNNVLACVYAGNVAGAVCRALDGDRPTGQAYNVANDGDLTPRTFAREFAAGLGVGRLRFVRISPLLAHAGIGVGTGLVRALGPRRYSGTGAAAVRFLTQDNPYVSTRAREELGWEPDVDAAVAVRRTGAFFGGPNEHGAPIP